MQVGAENRNKLILAIALGVIALVLVGRWMFVSGGSTAAAPATSTAPTAAPRLAAGGGKASAALRSLDPTLRYDWLSASEDTKYSGTGRNIFLAQEIPQPIAPGATDHPQNVPPPPPPGPPPPPPINLKFFGFANKPGETKKVFLSQGEDVFIAAEGDIIDRRYKILRITPLSVEVEDVLTNNRQSIPLTQG